MGLWSVKEALYTAWYFVQEYAQLHVDAVNALMHPIQTGEALGDKAVAYENSAAAYEGRTPTQTDYVIALILETVGGNQAAGGILGINVIEGRETSGWERFEDTTVGLANVASTVAGTGATALEVAGAASRVIRIGKTPAKPLPATKIPKNGETVTTRAGRQAHKDWDPGVGFEKEFTLPSGKRADAVNLEAKHVKELKPDNPKAIQKGRQQVERYRRELEKEYGGDWTCSVETYKRP
jgi:hypothetical protein